MTPMPALANEPNRPVGDAKLVCETLTGFAIRKPPFNFAHLIFSQLGFVVSYALHASPAFRAVFRIALVSIPTQMMLIDARRIVARMTS